MRRARALLWMLLSAACTQGAAPAQAQALRPRVLAVYPHDPHAFTEGLVWHEGKLYESTGIHGESTLRRVDPASGVVERSVALPESMFGEGVALVDERLVQLTWQSDQALVYDLPDFARAATFTYQGEGWGLCFDGQQLVMSDGSDELGFRDPSSFALRGRLAVKRDGVALSGLNELECVGHFVYANVYPTDEIVQIDARSGRVAATVDVSGLLSPEQAAGAGVPNGIAFDPETLHFYLTGKLWPLLFEVSFDLDADATDADAGQALATTPIGSVAPGAGPEPEPGPDSDSDSDSDSDPDPDPDSDPASAPVFDPHSVPDPNGRPTSSIERSASPAPAPLHTSDPTESSGLSAGCAVSQSVDASAALPWLLVVAHLRARRRPGRGPRSEHQPRGKP